jgi:hypothetical protein
MLVGVTEILRFALDDNGEAENDDFNLYGKYREYILSLLHRPGSCHSDWQ